MTQPQEPGQQLPVTADVVIRMTPLNYKYHHDLQELAQRIAVWVVDNVSKLTNARGADLFVLTALQREGEAAGVTYRDGQFVETESEDETGTEGKGSNDAESTLQGQVEGFVPNADS